MAGAITTSVNHFGPLLALRTRKRFRKDTVPIVDGTLVLTRGRTIAEQSRNCRCSTAHQVVIDAGSRLVAASAQHLPGNRHDSRGWAESGARAAVGNTVTIADCGCHGTLPAHPAPPPRRTG